MNFFTSQVSTEFIRAFAWTLFHSIWQVGLVALIAAGLMIILRRHKPAIRYLMLCISMVLLPVFFAGTFYFYFDNGKSTPDENSSFIVVHGEQNRNGISDNQSISREDASGSWFLLPSKLIDNQANLLVLIWFGGFLFFLVRFTGSLFLVYRLKNVHIHQVESQWQSKLIRLSDSIGLRKSVKLAESALARVPLTIGYLKPVILLPLGTLSGVPPQQIEAILLHELAHILRKDYLVNIMQSVIEIIFFYHPAAWWLSAQIRQEREHICDDLVISVNHDHINYIKALTTMEEFNVKSPLLANAVTGSRKQLLNRVKRLISPVKIRKGFSESIAVFLVILGLVFTFSLNALSVIPSVYDLSGRESGGNVYNLLPFNPEAPDTIKATSSSGKVSISVYTDSTSEAQQKTLQQIAESIDKNTGKPEHIEKQIVVHIDSHGDNKPMIWEESKMVVITKADSINEEGDSTIVIYNEGNKTEPVRHENYRFSGGHPAPAHTPEWNYSYSSPGSPEGEDVRVKVFRNNNDSVETLIFVNPEIEMNMKDYENFSWTEEEIQDLMKDQQMDWMELEQVNPPMPPDYMLAPEDRVPSSERIIRQELRDDGLTERGKKYVIELDSKAMYINGEKQDKDTYKKYRKLVESTEDVSFEGEDTFKMIF